jgi:hypothetical protein
MRAFSGVVMCSSQSPSVKYMTIHQSRPVVNAPVLYSTIAWPRALSPILQLVSLVEAPLGSKPS